MVVCFSSTASIIQQIYYACEWRNIKITALQQAKESVTDPILAYGPLSTGINLALFEVQFYCYTVNSVLSLLWALVLAKDIYDLHFKSLVGWETTIAACAKVFAIVVPGILVGVTFTEAVEHNIVVFVAITISMSRS